MDEVSGKSERYLKWGGEWRASLSNSSLEHLEIGDEKMQTLFLGDRENTGSHQPLTP